MSGLELKKMSTYIALIRGINVGGKNTLPMRDLVALLEDMGCENVETYIQSGNVVFQRKNATRDKVAKEISLKISKRFDFEPKVVLLESSDLQAAIEKNPYKIDDGKSLHFFFLDSIPKAPDMDRLTALKSKSEEFKLEKNIFYLYAPEGIGRSKLAASIEKSLGVAATARNWNTVKKLISLAKQGKKDNAISP
jgi:uncharacterized protein (DUF1697 family)